MSVAPGGPAREGWGSKTGFLMAAVGSAVGLGNMWRFSYVAAEGGGAAFVILYLVFVAFVGLPLLTSELVVGRMAQVSPVKALENLAGPRWKPVGILFAFCGLGILSYYSVIAGWTMRYALDAVRDVLPADAAGASEYFGSVGVGMPAIVTHLIFMAITIAVVMGGIKKGLERTAIILMPMLFIILIGLALWATTLSGGGAGYAYYLRPQLGELLNPTVITAAAGQAFFSLSLGMGALMTYASYLKGKDSLPKQAVTIAIADFAVAFIAGLFVFPVIFHFGLAETIGLGGQIADNTVGTLFITMPPALLSLSIGNWIVAAFFVMLFFAALTSAISLLEVVVSAVIDTWGWTRIKAAFVFGIMIAVLGLASAMNLNFLGVMDKLVGTVLLMLGGLLTSILVGYRIREQAEAEIGEGLSSAGLRRAWIGFMRYVIPPVLLVVMAFSVPGLIAAVKALFG
ncbi:MAG: sodium-dependent transporter [Gemmatimonadales bacterium]|nr:MAG: sodium-dependent transporter [Gemmatimonadales bacterium]